MLPPDFYERKRAVYQRLERTRLLHSLREHRVDPDTFPHRFLSPEEETIFLATVNPLHRWDCPLMEKVPTWESITGRIRAWAACLSEVAIWYDAGPGNGGLVLPGNLVAESLDSLISAVKQQGNVMLATPDGQTGCVYSEQEHENLFGMWGRA